MKLKKPQIILVFGGCLVLVFSACVLLTMAARRKTNQPQDGFAVRWSPHLFQVASKNSKLSLHLDDLAPEGNWIVGIEPIEPNAPECIAVGVVTWGSSAPNQTLAAKHFSLSLISDIHDLSPDQIDSKPGKVSISRLNGASPFGSVIVQLKVARGTKVHVIHGGKEFADDSQQNGLVIHNGLIKPGGSKSLRSLVGHLMRSKMVNP